MKLVVVLCLVFICFVRQGHGSFGEFMVHLPSEVGHAFEVAWISVTDLIKSPVKSRKLRPAGKRRRLEAKRKTTVLSTTFMPTTEISNFHVEFKKSLNTPYIDYTSSTQSGIRLKIPLIDKPTFRSVHEWRQLQKPRILATLITRCVPPTTPATTAVSPAPVKQLNNNNLKDHTKFGRLPFI